MKSALSVTLPFLVLSTMILALPGCSAPAEDTAGGSGGKGGTATVGGAGTGGLLGASGSAGSATAGASGMLASGGSAASSGASGSGGLSGAGGSGGSGDGGAAGSPTCEASPPPDNVADWIDESWDAQLGDNIDSREAWLLDNVMMGEGQINLCVRWGATSAPSTTVKSQIASSVQGWFNDWFQALGDHNCFPHGDGITVKVTGWAVRPGNESWVSDLGPEIKVYTETDNEDEPKCPDACSFFSNWDHQFPDCSGGEAFHTDYWIWVDDELPGEGNAAAVGGDWGLRMPVAPFIDSLGESGSGVIEHEIGHGFGFQDYYTWEGSEPAGGSLMIVGSQDGGTPTVGDTWLLRRTWDEMRTLRGW